MKIEISPDYQYMAKELFDIPRMFDEEQGEIVYSGRNFVRRFIIQGTPVVAKRFKRVNFFQQIAYTFFRSTKAERAFRYAGIFRKCGIETPHEIAFLETYEHGLFTTGYFICTACPDPPAFPFLVPKEDYDKTLATDLVSLIVSMHQKGIVHGDLNFGNFLFRKSEKEAHYQFQVIDINRSLFFDTCPPKEVCLKNLSTITHRRDLFEFMVREYARQREWDEEETLAHTTGYLQKLEQKHARKEKIKRLFKR